MARQQWDDWTLWKWQRFQQLVGALLIAVPAGIFLYYLTQGSLPGDFNSDIFRWRKMTIGASIISTLPQLSVSAIYRATQNLACRLAANAGHQRDGRRKVVGIGLDTC